jgi:hypothetical protein
MFFLDADYRPGPDLLGPDLRGMDGGVAVGAGEMKSWRVPGK